MTIAHVVYGLPIGGIETMLVNIANEQASLGHKIHIVVINDMVDPSITAKICTSVAIHLLNRKKGSRNPLPVLRLNNVLIQVAPDVIHLHFSSISRYIFIPSLRKRLCVTLHSLCSTADVKYLGHSGPIFAISDMVKSDIKTKLGLEAITVCNGIDISQIKRRGQEAHDSLPFKIIQVGRLNSALKGQDILIRAVFSLVKSGRNITLTLIGDGESRAELETLVSELGISKHVKFLGSQTQEYVLSHLAEYDLFVQPSRFEGFGLTVVEAMAAGIPVLVSENNGPIEVIDHGRYGYSFFKGDHVDCAERIIEIMDNYPSIEFLNAAERRVESCYNVKRTASRYIQLYNELIGNM